MSTYVINDIWSSLKKATRYFFITTLVIGAIVFLSGMFFLNDGTNKNENLESIFAVALLATPFIVFVLSIFVYRANRRYVVDEDAGLITFPRSDVENSLLEVIFLMPWVNLLRTKTISIDDIENVYIDTKRWTTKSQVANGKTASGKTKYRTETKRHVLYTINITGRYGSDNLDFTTRQKRDEVRNAISQSIKRRSGRNVDRKVAEFS